jgi:hypothetical protein
MIHIFKCDYCYHFSDSLKEIETHEKECDFNPSNKKCLTCAYSWDSGHDFPIPECEKHLSTIKGMEEGNCEEWEKM